VFGVSYLTGGAIALICAYNLVRLFAGKVRDDELIEVHEEGMAEAIEAEHEMAEQEARAQAAPGARR
jgi:hypothetical protein